jgi:hypothetical protein
MRQLRRGSCRALQVPISRTPDPEHRSRATSFRCLSGTGERHESSCRSVDCRHAFHLAQRYSRPGSRAEQSLRSSSAHRESATGERLLMSGWMSAQMSAGAVPKAKGLSLRDTTCGHQNCPQPSRPPKFQIQIQRRAGKRSGESHRPVDRVRRKHRTHGTGPNRFVVRRRTKVVPVPHVSEDSETNQPKQTCFHHRCCH